MEDEETVRHKAPAESPHEGVPSSVAMDPEREIVAAIRRGDHRAALAQIDDRFGHALYRFVRNLVGADDTADDVYQMTLLAAFRDLASFSERSSVRTWMFGIARHRSLDALKAGRRRAARFASVDTPEVPDGAPRADERIRDSQLVAALEQCLDEVPPDLRTVLLLRFQEGFTYDDIARITRLRNETLRARVSRAMPALRDCIDRRGAL